MGYYQEKKSYYKYGNNFVFNNRSNGYVKKNVNDNPINTNTCFANTNRKNTGYVNNNKVSSSQNTNFAKNNSDVRLSTNNFIDYLLHNLYEFDIAEWFYARINAKDCYLVIVIAILTAIIAIMSRGYDYCIDKEKLNFYNLFVTSMGWLFFFILNYAIKTRGFKDKSYIDGKAYFVFLFIAMPYSLFFTNGVLLTVNRFLDTKPVVSRYVEIEHRFITRSYRNSNKYGRSKPVNTYRLRFSSWERKDIEIFVDNSLFDRVEKGEIVDLNVKPGFLGLEYVLSDSIKYIHKKNDFPPNTKFPILKTEGDNLIEEYKQKESIINDD